MKALQAKEMLENYKENTSDKITEKWENYFFFSQEIHMLYKIIYNALSGAGSRNNHLRYHLRGR